MNVLAISGFFIGFTCLFLAIFILRYGTNDVQKSFGFQNFAISLWGFGNGFAAMATLPNKAIFWWKIALTGGFYIIPLLLNHTLLLNNLSRKKLLISLWIWATIYPILCILNLDGMIVTYIFSKFYLPQPANIFYIVYYMIWVIMALYVSYLVIKGYLTSLPAEKIAMLLYAIAYLGGMWGGATYIFMAAFNINMLYPYGNFLISLYCGIVTYAIFRHKLMNIEVIIRRALVFAGLFAFVYAVFAGMAYLTQIIFQNIIGLNRWIAMIPSVLIVIFTLKPLERLLVNATDKFLFQKKYDYRDLLKIFSSEVLTVLDLAKLVNLTVGSLSKIIHLENCAVLIYDKDKDNYPVLASLGLKEPNQIFDKNTHLVNYLLRTHHYLLKDKTISNLRDAGTVKEDLKKLNAELVIPVVLHDDLMGALALGRKKSGEEFTQDDLAILIPLSQTLAIAISNAQLFVELSKTQQEAAQKEKMAVIGTLASGINHEICNPLGIARGQCEAFLLNKRDGIYHDKPDTEQLTEAMRVMELVIKETDRATSITKKLSSFAKPSKGELADDVDISKELDEVISLVGYELKLDKIELVKNIPPSLPHIRADKKQLQEIFFNLIRNAAQAITESGKITISAHEMDSKVIINIADTGCGIPEDKLGMIFNPFYTTKEPGKGTGLGLFIVRQVVERNRGRISLKSKAGEGTTFTLEFPIS